MMTLMFPMLALLKVKFCSLLSLHFDRGRRKLICTAYLYCISSSLYCMVSCLKLGFAEKRWPRAAMAVREPAALLALALAGPSPLGPV